VSSIAYNSARLMKRYSAEFSLYTGGQLFPRAWNANQRTLLILKRLNSHHACSRELENLIGMLDMGPKRIPQRPCIQCLVLKGVLGADKSAWLAQVRQQSARPRTGKAATGNGCASYSTLSQGSPMRFGLDC